MTDNLISHVPPIYVKILIDCLAARITWFSHPSVKVHIVILRINGNNIFYQLTTTNHSNAALFF